jgi:hypothetical protein
VLINLAVVLEAPQQSGDSNDGFLYQICISRKLHNDTLEDSDSPRGPTNREDRVKIIRGMVSDWAEPFRSFVMLISDSTDVKQLDLDDCAPENATKPTDRVMLVGDAFHAMTMCKQMNTASRESRLNSLSRSRRRCESHNSRRA